MPMEEDLLNLPRTQTHKSDARSTVWQVTTSNGQAVVIKRFEHSPLRQMLARWFHLHPAQREARVNARMLRQHIPVAPIMALDWQRTGLGCRGWLATRYVGPSLQQHLRNGTLQGDMLDAAVTRLAALVARLIASGWYFRDLKTSNLVMAADGQPLLIDVGSARPLRTISQREKMLGMLEKTSLGDGMPVAAWQRLHADALSL
jgi:tRNA A-37 threonylcarbamoyl transferase component Bud32